MSNLPQDDLTTPMLDANGLPKWAVYLPALSGFYGTIVSKQRFEHHTDPARIPAAFNNGIEGMNWLNKDAGYFHYKWTLYSAGHAKLDLTKEAQGEDMIRNRDRANSFLLMDSGGYQIATGKWEGDWRAGSGCPKAQEKRDQVLKWIDGVGDYGMILDIPTWVIENPQASKACNISTYEEAVEATKFNNEYFIKNRKGVKEGGAKFLNVMQGLTHGESDKWYNLMKQYNDPKLYPGRHFDGWSFGGQNASSPTLTLKRIVNMIYDGYLQEGLHDWIHMLGVSRIEWGLFCTDIQNAVRRNHNGRLTISFDSASPFLATANGQVYAENIFTDRAKWRFYMTPSVDDKKYATDTRLFRDAALADGHIDVFEQSPIIDRCLMKDICYYQPGMLNKVGKEGRTSWDTFSYALLMGHNVHRHISALQKGNTLYENLNSVPAMLIYERNARYYVRDIVNEIFDAPTREKSLELIDHYDRILSRIIGGNKGYTGKNERNAHTSFNAFFEVEDDVAPVVEESDEPVFDDKKLQDLEDEEENS